MESSESGANNPQEPQERRICYPVSSTKQMIFDQIKTLPLQFKLVLYAFLTALSQDKKNIKVTVADVFLEFKKIATGLKIERLSPGRVSDLVKELEMLGFLNANMFVRPGGR